MNQPERVGLIREEFGIVMTYAFSLPSLTQLRATKFKGDWKQLETTLFDIPRSRAIRAAIEMALHLRALDDEARLGEYLRQTGAQMPFGQLERADRPDKRLTLRDVVNKIVHAGRMDWDASDPMAPKLECTAGPKQDWKRAHINLVAVAAFCGKLG